MSMRSDTLKHTSSWKQIGAYIMTSERCAIHALEYDKDSWHTVLVSCAVSEAYRVLLKLRRCFLFIGHMRRACRAQFCNHCDLQSMVLAGAALEHRTFV